MNPTAGNVLDLINSGLLASVIRGDLCVFSTPASINDDMRPTDHEELLEHGIYPLIQQCGVNFIIMRLEEALRQSCTDALGVFCAHQCFYIELVKEDANDSPISISRDDLAKFLARVFLRESTALHSLEVRAGDALNDRSYKVTLAGMRILERDHGVDWGLTLP
jgi:hypothetical protein